METAQYKSCALVTTTKSTSTRIYCLPINPTLGAKTTRTNKLKMPQCNKNSIVGMFTIRVRNANKQQHTQSCGKT